MPTCANTFVDRLPPIGLDRLIGQAALLTRVDRKYLPPVADLPTLLGPLTGRAEVLQIDGQRQFSYQSVYFDTPDLGSFHAAARRRRHRYKVRLRSYLDSDRHVVEVKTRGRRGITIKHQLPCADTAQWAAGSRAGLAGEIRTHVDAVLADAGFRTTGLPLRPVLSTTYRRTTLFLPAAGSRVTIDVDLGWTLPDGTGLRVPHRAVVETKSPGGTSAVDRLLWSAGHRPCVISKYATGLAVLRPELPANRWQPALRRLFPTTPIHGS
ncbi:molecular chaperone [Micromonospora endophytica]|uniref:Molecular chaperone n=2 Tax=Micromonospora endophytica TaxID=515350 RepID=A0A2W2BP37_9ACTN|nr:molecular chaperone [Micromonospora endophytica]RIW41090.1 polyphosphate polymerase domain-containing protein [Micromonospora endophytica]